MNDKKATGCAEACHTGGAPATPTGATIVVKAGNAFIAPPGTKVIHEEDQVGASTVLTPERIAELLALVGPTAGIYDDSYDLSIAKIQKLMRLAQQERSDQNSDIANAMFALDCAVNALEYMRSERDAAIAREVAAQAGQVASVPSAVAVPEDVARDAARYQFLRHADLDELARMYWPESEVPEGIELDEAIDAAMSATPSPAKESK